MWPIALNFGSAATTAGLVTLGAPDAASNREHVERALKWLRSRKVDVKWGEHALDSVGFLAASPKALATDLHSMLTDQNVDFVLTTGGGANSNEVLPYLSPDLLRHYPKPIIGLSNTTVVLNYLSAASDVITFHGPVMVWNIGAEGGLDVYTESYLRNALTGVQPLVVEPESSWRWIRPGTARGRIWGGNLWSFEQLLATPYLPDLSGAVLFLEECFSELHNVAASLTHLAQAGVFKRLSGLIVGVPLECVETEMQDNREFETIVIEACAPYDFPILAGVHLGHTDRKITVPVGACVSLNSSRGDLLFESVA
ncbi:MAG: LD-carboxypeptidase [Candidatus Accumulibacter sp. UW25]|jgi:muramoyltetrapeptide carboxypeptidase